MAQGEGCWTSHLILDGEIKWQIDDNIPEWSPSTPILNDGTKLLPSDMEYRADIPPMLVKDWETAEDAKV